MGRALTPARASAAEHGLQSAAHRHDAHQHRRIQVVAGLGVPRAHRGILRGRQHLPDGLQHLGHDRAGPCRRSARDGVLCDSHRSHLLLPLSRHSIGSGSRRHSLLGRFHQAVPDRHDWAAGSARAALCAEPAGAAGPDVRADGTQQQRAGVRLANRVQPHQLPRCVSINPLASCAHRKESERAERKLSGRVGAQGRTCTRSVS